MFDVVVVAAIIASVIAGIFAIVVALIEVLGAIARELLIYYLKRKQQKETLDERQEG